MRGLDRRRAEAAQVSIALVVCKNEDEIRFSRNRGSGGQHEDHERAQEANTLIRLESGSHQDFRLVARRSERQETSDLRKILR